MRLWAISTVALLLIGGMVLAQDVVLLGGETQVNDYTLGPQRQSAVAADAEGDFVVVWQSTYSDGNDTSNSIQAQRFDSGGTLVGSQFEVNTFTTGAQLRPRAALDTQGKSVIAWYSLGSDGTDDSWYSVQAQGYASRPVLVDSFESGDLSAWSSIVQ